MEKEMMKQIQTGNDHLVRMTAAGLQLRAFAVQSRDIAEVARRAHDTWPVATAALGRLLSAGAMMGFMLKSEQDLLTLQIKCDGPIGGLTVTADAFGNVKGYANVPQFEGYARIDHKLDVGGALGYGTLTVIKDLGLKEPFAGTTELITGEIAEDLTYYFATSEQTPSSVGLGVLLNQEDGSVRQAGGFLIQVMPDAKDEVIDRLEQNLSEIQSVTSLLEEGLGPKEILERILSGLDPVLEEMKPCRFFCDCSREKIEKVLLSLGSQDLRDLAAGSEDVEVKCHFCNTAYKFSPATIGQMLAAVENKTQKES